MRAKVMLPTLNAFKKATEGATGSDLQRAKAMEKIVAERQKLNFPGALIFKFGG